MTSTLDRAYKIFKQYESLLNSYVSDYYIEDHWQKLLLSWQETFKNVTPMDMALILDLTKPLQQKIYPLSFLCLRLSIIQLTLPRKMVQNTDHLSENKEFTKYFWKNVKMKKRHEINILSKLCADIAEHKNCRYIIDIGSGLGHLSRMLSYGYGFHVLTFEADKKLNSLATNMDTHFEETLERKKIKHRKVLDVIHICKRITQDLTSEDFLHLVQTCFCNNDKNIVFGIVGLHPCGGLGSTLLKLYNNCPNAAFITMASCCYMKMNLDSSFKPDFPLSKYCKLNDYQLSYLSCEIACHAIENFAQKLKDKHKHCELKIHAYRAALEKVLVSLNPKLKHSMVCNVKYTKTLTLCNYISRTLEKYSLSVSQEDIEENASLIENTWEQVVIFYSLRLLLAPLVETIILLDRQLYIEESNSSCKIVAAFDSEISPRNLVLVAEKR